jgi:hypothetical protein
LAQIRISGEVSGRANRDGTDAVALAVLQLLGSEAAVTSRHVGLLDESRRRVAIVPLADTASRAAETRAKVFPGTTRHKV